MWNESFIEIRRTVVLITDTSLLLVDSFFQMKNINRRERNTTHSKKKRSNLPHSKSQEAPSGLLDDETRLSLINFHVFTECLINLPTFLSKIGLGGLYGGLQVLPITRGFYDDEDGVTFDDIVDGCGLGRTGDRINKQKQIVSSIEYKNDIIVCCGDH